MTAESAPELVSAALFERDGRVLAVHRGAARPPFAGQWLLPLTVVRDDEAAEDAVRRHAVEQFGVAVGVEQFVDTVYLQDTDDRRYVVNIFRVPIESGPMRFNAAGDYDDARWLAPTEVDQLIMPAPLHAALARYLAGEREPGPAGRPAPPAAGEAPPLPERPAPEAPVPDNRASWDAISASYQDERFGEMYGDRFMWSFVSSEDDLHVLEDVRGKRVLVLGCGGGQDCVALERMGAVAVGIDQSPRQIEYARKYAARHEAPNAAFVEGTAEDLSRFDDASFDLVVSSHALNYVGRIEDALAEAHRVLRGGGVLACSVTHPISALVSDEPPYVVERSYWDEVVDWAWEFEGVAPARFRQRMPSLSRWFDMLDEAGFVVERVIEPREDGRRPPPQSKSAWDAARARMLPDTIIFKARKR